jgi:uncharacterized protein (DUF1800 family)
MLSPLSKDKWTYDTAAHLAARAGFGESPSQLERWTKQGMDATIQELLHPDPDQTSLPKCATPNQLADLRARVNQATDSEEKKTARQTLRDAENQAFYELISWWTQRMLTTRAPLLEKMTLFWHGHFATSAAKVRSPYKLWQQNETLRRDALGNFVTLTKAISRDPAMMVYLDLASSQAEHPNENFARELMELFTLGEGHYTEPDIKESARAFTGYRIDRFEQFRFAKNQCDAGSKTFMAQTGNWDGDEIIDIILRQPVAAKFICTKIWKYFAYEDPAAELTDRLAEIFRQNYEIRQLLETIFLSEEFYSQRARDAIGKSPVQYIVEAGRTLGVSIPNGFTLFIVYLRMGQTPFYPPNVKGWDGGKSWINTATLTFRYQLARQLVLGIREVNQPRPKTTPPASPSPSALASSSAQPSPSTQTANTMTQTDNSSGQSGISMAQTENSMEQTENTKGQSLKAMAQNAVRLPALPLANLVTIEDRADPEAALRRIYARVFQTTPDPQFFSRILAVIKEKPLPLSDDAIRDLVALIMMTPNYQVC